MRGKTVAILESRLGPQMVDLVAKHGGVPMHAPALAEVPDVDPEFVAGLVRDAAVRPAKLAIFQTGVGTRALFAATDALGLTGQLLDLLATTTVAVRGPKPTAALRARNVRIDLSARDPFTTHAVTFTNAAQVHNLFAIATPHGGVDALRTALNRTLIASVGPVASSALREFGVRVDVEASPPKLGPLVSALDAALSR